MTFSEIIKNDADQKYLQLLSGKTECSITNVQIISCDEYIKKNENYHKRLNQEAEELKEALKTIKANKEEADRIKEEEYKAKKKAEREAKRAEEERLRLERKAEEERLKIEFEKAKADAARKRKVRIIAIVSIIVAFIVTIVISTVVVGAIINAAKYSEKNIVISILSKGSGFKNYSDNNYVTGLEMKVENRGSINILEVHGLMEIYNAKEQKLLATNVTLTGNIYAKKSVTFQLDINEKESDKIRELFNTSLDSLKITFKLTEVVYDGYRIKNFDNATARIISVISKDALGNSSDENNITFRKVSNYIIDNSTELLKWLHHDVSNNVIVPDQGLTYISYTNNYTWYKGPYYNADYNQSYTGSQVFFQIDASYANTIVDTFKQKLSNEGWTSVYDDGYDFEYVKDKTHIVFESVKESIVWNGYSNEIEYYYMNFSAFNAN